MPKTNKLTIFSWSMYDFANTIFSMNVISLYFVLWVTVDKQGQDIFYSIALSGSMLLSALSAPFLGAISDKTGRKMPFLITLTALCCTATACLGLISHLVIGLILFAFANYCYQVADTFYNALLPIISPIRQLGKVSGFGVGLGYLGTITGLLLTAPFVIYFGHQAAFIPTAFFFFLFALPCFIFVKERFNPPPYQKEMEWVLIQAFSKLKTTLTHIKAYHALFVSLLALFIIFNTVNTVYIFMSVYVKKVMGFSDQHLIALYLSASIFAAAGSVAAGYMTDKIGAKKALSIILMAWAAALISAILTSNYIFFWAIGCTVGACLGATQTSARALIAHIAPRDMLGEVFGFYGLMGKSASIVGPLIWGLSTWLLAPLGLIKYRLTILILLGFLIIGFFILQKVPRHAESK